MPEPARHLVVDASVFVDLLAGTDQAERARVALSGAVLHAPAHVDAEVLFALARLERAGRIGVDRADAGVVNMIDAPVVRHPVHELMQSAWTQRSSLRVTDALYVALAEQLDAPLVTTDARLARARPDAVDVSVL